MLGRRIRFTRMNCWPILVCFFVQAAVCTQYTRVIYLTELKFGIRDCSFGCV